MPSIAAQLLEALDPLIQPPGLPSGLPSGLGSSFEQGICSTLPSCLNRVCAAVRWLLLVVDCWYSLRTASTDSAPAVVANACCGWLLLCRPLHSIPRRRLLLPIILMSQLPLTQLVPQSPPHQNLGKFFVLCSLFLYCCLKFQAVHPTSCLLTRL